MPIAPRFRLTAAATATALAALPASAPAAETGWLDLISPDRLVTQLLQTGILMARTQVDLQYSDLTVNALSGTATMTDISIWPLPDWDENGDCVIEIERLTLQGTPLDDPSTMKLRLQVTGGGVDPTCLPPDAAPIVQMTGQDWFDLPRLTLDVSYDVPSAGADLHLYADVSGVAAVDLSAEFTYLWFDGRGDMDNPDPVIFLSHAALTVFDVNGRLVRRVLSGSLTAGVHDVRWDGRSDVGADVGAGIYLARLDAGSRSRTVKLVRAN